MEVVGATSTDVVGSAAEVAAVVGTAVVGAAVVGAAVVVVSLPPSEPSEPVPSGTSSPVAQKVALPGELEVLSTSGPGSG